MKVSCFCGHDYEFDGQIGPCPKCDRIATTGGITERQAQFLIESEILDFLDSIDGVSYERPPDN